MDSFRNMVVALVVIILVVGVQSRPSHSHSRHSDIENFVGEKEYICGAKPADVVFLLDTSNSIWGPHFTKQLDFVNQVVDFFIIGKENIRVGAVTFSDGALKQFDLKDYDNKPELKRAISNIEQWGGIYTFTDKAINFAATKSFTPEAGARDGVTRVAIVVTDGRSYETSVTAIEAEAAREQGIHMFAIGVGHGVDKSELISIASQPTNEYMFMVDDFDSLGRIKELLAIKTCTVTDPPTTTTTPLPTTTTTTPIPTTTTTLPVVKFESKPPILVELSTTPNLLEHVGKPSITFPETDENWGTVNHRKGCIPKQPLDLAFIVDEKQGGSDYKRKLWKFVRNTVSKLNFEDGDIRISFIRECADVPEVHLGQFNKSALLKHLDTVRPQSARTAGLLRAMTKKLGEDETFSDNKIIQDSRHKVGVYITDGESQDLHATLREAQNAKFGNDIELFAVGVTDKVNPVELNALVSCEPEDHLLTVGSHASLNKFYKKLAHKICRAPL